MLAKLRSMWRMRSRREGIYSQPTFWNDKATTHEGTAVSMFVNRTLNEYYQRDQFRFFDEALGDVNGKHILDVGCGTGRLSRHLASHGAKVSAFDFADKAIEIAKRESTGMSIEYRVGSVFDIEAVAHYDHITVLGCLTAACKSPEEFSDVIGKLRAALRPGGRLVMIEPFHRGFLHRVLRMSKADVHRKLQAEGFDLLTTRELHFWPARLVLTVGETPTALTKAIYPIGEFILRCSPALFGLGDYKAISAVRTP